MLRMTFLPAKSRSVFSDRSLPTSVKSGAFEPTAGRSPTVCTTLPLNLVVAMRFVYRKPAASARGEAPAAAIRARKAVVNGVPIARSSDMPRLHIGISGWQYAGWRGDFYPVEIPQRRHLEYATRLLGAVEVNGTFYSLKSPASYEKWYRTAAEGSVLAIKGSRYISHRLRLEAVDTALANFFANGLLRLEDKLGPILWQF